MFACIHSRSVVKTAASDEVSSSPLVELAFTFSPLVEQTSADTVVFDIAGQDLLFGCVMAGESALAMTIARAITQRAEQLNAPVNVALAANVDAAIHAARSFEGITIIDAGDELPHLAKLSLQQLDCSLAAVMPDKAEEIHETLSLWGMRTFRDLAELPLRGVAERLGQDGVRLQKLAQGKTDRALNLVHPPVGFAQSLELEHPVSEIEPLSFILSRLLNQLCANLNQHALATNELKLRLGLESPSLACNQTQQAEGAGNAVHERTITLPVPTRNHKTLLRLLLFEIEREPPAAPVAAITITAEPVKPRAAQAGLFIPAAPEPEKLEITLARLTKLLGAENVGSPVLLDTHRPDAFRLNKFQVIQRKRRNAKQAASRAPVPCGGFRIFRPPSLAEVHTLKGQPVRLEARAQLRGKLSGRIVRAAGPWRASGDWWRPDVWARDEWDVAVIDPRQATEVLCRIYRDLTNEQWFVAGIYD